MGSNPTPSAMPLHRPQTLINTRVSILMKGQKGAFLGQVSLKVSLLGSRRHYPSLGCQKARTTRMLLPIGNTKGKNGG